MKVGKGDMLNPELTIQALRCITSTGTSKHSLLNATGERWIIILQSGSASHLAKLD